MTYGVLTTNYNFCEFSPPVDLFLFFFFFFFFYFFVLFLNIPSATSSFTTNVVHYNYILTGIPFPGLFLPHPLPILLQFNIPSMFLRTKLLKSDGQQVSRIPIVWEPVRPTRLHHRPSELKSAF